MAGNKTQETTRSVEAFVDAIAEEGVRDDCRVLMRLMHKVTGEQARMWGASMVGFGRYHYVYDSGRAGDMFLAGFAPRKKDLTVYLMGGFEAHPDLMGRLGKYRTGKACLYLRRLEDIDATVLEELIRRSVAYLQARYPA